MTEANERLSVTLGLQDGGVRQGWLDDFSPAMREIKLHPPIRIGAPRAPTAVLQTSDVAYIAFDRRPPALPAGAPGAAPKRCRLHAVGGRAFLVNVAEGDLDRPLGFFAIPAAEKDPVACFYFYSHGLNAREEDRPLGDLLIRDGVIEEDDVRRGLELQSQMRPPLGELLVAEGLVLPAQVEHAAALQQRRGVRIGEVLVEAGAVSQEAVERAVAEQRARGGKRLGEILLDMGALTEEKLAAALAEKFFLPFVDLADYPIQPAAVDEVGRALIEKHCLLPIASDDTTLTVAIADPLAVDGIDALRFRLGKRIKEVVVTLSQLREFIALGIRKKDEHAEGFEQILRELDDSELTAVDSHEDEREATALDSAVVKLVYQIIADALRRGASDVHIEPNGRNRKTTVRFRVNGECEAYQEVPASLRRALVARLKILAGLDIAERRKPQDGKTAFRIRKQTIEVRVATIPTSDGDEDAVLRILTHSRALAVSELGFSADNRTAVLAALQRPHGLILCVGPTGSGKTTTLHSLLGQINTVDRKIWTAEDPVEITQPGLRQVQMHPKIGLTFAAALRAFLRADPDVIMVGEMRDQETATIAVEASLTGHLVLSTLHTNGAPETVTRLLEMGIEPFSFADALLAVLAQRLVRGLCPACREARPPTPEELAHLSSMVGAEAVARLLAGPDGAPRVWTASGCTECAQTGYKGRMAIHELLIGEPTLSLAIQRKAPAAEIRSLARASGMVDMLHDGLRKVSNGITDLRQVLAAAGQ